MIRTSNCGILTEIGACIFLFGLVVDLLLYCCIVVLYSPLLKWHCGRMLERLCAVFRWPMVALCLMYSGLF